ncbi:LOW QUALITY PROTEIN: abnormal spindle-like microcephaly-associated protein [Arvicanthis niloticus]|uniref:LOW QUALITY PROTEIN: abnormal spindle-like microcephaly-associated protein n=1 Tax=Arvicanthis niloticus TaxID=61156 RepID=UPI00148708F7|nr:LOW QUALITY PROTEIN: abnormal spindle-like microcephaly-associated protein [Arvicanthis niloticus]
MATVQAASSREESGRRERPDPAPGDASPPVLLLSHFCAVPFLCFGDVRVGTSRTRSLVLHNPHEEPLQVEVSLLRAAGKGFSVSRNRCELKPKEKITISVTWTPVQEGGVREIVTFLVNDFLKHQAILLGNAEEHRKKKRSLWNTSKKIPAFSKHTKRTSKTQTFNESFTISHKVDRIRSPLQPCENLAMSECCSPTENSSLPLEENKVPTSSISPVRECQSETCLPLFLRESTAYSSLHESENAQNLKVQDASISKKIDFNEEVANETFINPISVRHQSEGDSKLTLAPNCSSPLNITQTQIQFLSPDSFINNSYKSDSGLRSVKNALSDTFRKDPSESVCLESQIVHEVCQTILSPDSFLNDNYGLKKGLNLESVIPVLSPTQFVKDNMVHIGQQTGKLSALSTKTQDWRVNEGLAYNPECQHAQTPNSRFENQNPIEMKSHNCGFTKEKPKISELQDAFCNQSKQPKKRRPILSATVTKRKPTNAREKLPEINKPKAKCCLEGLVGECGKEMDNLREKGFHSSLPVVEPLISKPPSYRNEVIPSTVVVARKRKSNGIVGDANGKLAVAEWMDVCEIKRIHFSPLESTPSTVARTTKKEGLTSKRVSSLERSGLKKKPDSLILKTPLSKTKKKRRSIVAVAQSHLTFIKPLKAAIPRHPMPFAAKNMFYDERWKEKQEQGFTWWLNYILTPDDFTVKTSVSKVNAATLVLGAESQHKISVPKAPTKEEVSLRAYTASCRLNRLRRTACSLFTSEKMVKAIKKIEIEIEVGRLLVRKDRHLWKDIGQRQKVLSWLLSYNPLWLRIGLETVFGELIPLADNSDTTGLAMFILNRLLWNPDIAAEYRHPSVPLLFRDGHEAALSKFTLKKLLLLICFLDHAKISRLIDHDPCLFCKDAEFKASKELLLAFSRDFLSGEGDLSRHLSLLGLPVSHVQTPRDEFDFAVTNLAVDLQCGVRLVRTVELLTQNWNLSDKLRIPAISRVQKMHNVDLVLQVLKARGVSLTDEHGNAIMSKDIVDRHREKTLGLLWKIAFAFQVDISLNLDQLKEEIDFLKHTYNIKKAMSALTCPSPAITNKQKDKRISGSFEHYSDSVKLLMDWVNAVCAFYNKKVENFTVSFSDGRVLCYLIHHYHPCYVPFDAICQRTTQSVACTQTGSVVLNSSSESESGCLDLSLEALDHESTPEIYKELLENEKKNFHLVTSAARDLGGIPSMIHHSDMSNTIPDEKVVITYLSFLCARLLDLRKEIRAARLIQTRWRQYKLKRDLKHHQERDKAARIIQSVVFKFLSRRRWQKKVSAALVIQKCWRRVSAQRKLLMLKTEKLARLQSKSASLIQACWRRYSTRRQFLRLKHYSVILQSRIRMKIALTSYKRYLWAAVTIQRHWRAYLSRKRDQERFQNLKSSSLVIQRMFRRWKRRKLQLQTKAAVTLQRAFREWHFRKQTRERSAVVIQSWYRMHRELQKYVYIRSCVVVIQREVRCFQAQKLYKRRKDAILTLQKHYRAYQKGKLARTDYLQKRAAAIRLQAAFRGMKARRSYNSQIRAACVFQSCWRMRQERIRFLNLKKIVIKLQAHIRKYQQLQKYKKIKKAAITIQTHFRAYILAKKVLASYQKTRSSVIVLQSAYRGMQARKTFRHAVISVIKIQSYYRAYIFRKKFQSFRNATIKLQSVVKMKQSRKQYLQVRAAALLIQRWYRSQKLAAQKRKEYIQVRESCIKLQSYFRGYLVRKQMKLQSKAAVSLQSYFRMRTARQRYLKMCAAAVVIQSFYCAYRAQVRQRKKFLQVKGAAICLQAAYRGCRVRRQIKQQSTGAVTIQRVFRGHSQRVKYQTMLQSAVKIQRWYRAHSIGYDMRIRFLKTREAVVSLQSAYRGWQVRQQLRRQYQAAVKIQSAFRMARAQKQYKLLRTAAVVIQQHVRARAAGKRQHLEYIKLRHAALVFQATWRGKTLRRQIAWQHQCASLIQSYYRMHVQRRKWSIMKTAARQIQACYRAYKVGKEQRHLYLKTKAAIIILQSAYRGMKVRKQISECHKAAVTIQSKFRAYRTQKKYMTYRTSAIIIQRWYRNIKMTTQQHQEYLNLKRTAIKVQAAYRGMRVRKHIQHMHLAATLIQATFKMHQARVRYHKMRTAAVVIQVRYTAYYLGKIQHEKYLMTLKAIKTLQAGVRGARVRQTVRQMHFAATLIQSYFRRHRQQTYFHQLKKAATVVQQRYRALKEGSAQFQRYSRLRHSVILLQAAFRGLRTRRHLKAMHFAATLIQRRFRTLLMRRKFLCLRKTVIWIQRQYRARLHAKYSRQQLLLEKAVTKIQSSYKGWVVRKRVQRMHRAATVIQATFRMHRACMRYQHLKWASVVIQKQYQAHRATKLQRQLFLRQRHAAVILQAAFRGMKTRNHLKTMHSSATLIQSRFRALIVRKQFIALRKAAIFVQRKYRATLYAKHILYQFLQLRKAAITIQSSYRRLMVQKKLQEMHRAAALIQATFRMHRTYVRFHIWKHASIRIQRHYRTYTTIKLQKEKRIREEKHSAAVRIQSTYRMHRQRCFYQQLLWAAKVIQKKYRANKRQQDLPDACKEETPLIQMHFQGLNTAKQVQQQHEAAVIIQKHFRAFKARRLMESERGFQAVWRKCKAKKYLSKVEAACRIQAWYRCWRTRKRYVTLLKAVKIIQGYFFAKLERTRFLKMRAAAIIIQRTWRAVLSARGAHENLKRHRAACVIQAHFRGYKGRQSFLQQRCAILIIQRHVRAMVAAKRERIKYIKLKKSMVVLQALVRGWLVRKRVSEQKAKIRLFHFTAAAYCHMCALRIQRAYRLHVALRDAKEHVNSVICIQRWFRRRLQQKRFIEQFHKIIKAEREAQACRRQQDRAASVIQKAVHRFLLYRRQERINSSATRIQALWRGYSWRKKNDCTEIKAIRGSLRAVNGNVEEENKLYRRTERALHHLLTCKHLSAILDALKHLEVVTRLSPLCCENMAGSGAVSTIFVLIRSCNRSVPCMEVVGYAVQVLLNVAKYDKTISSIYDADHCVDTLLELLQVYREKPGDRVAEKSASIFTRTCCLLAVLLKTEQCAFDAQSRSKVIDRIYRLYKFTVPKHKVNTQGLFDKQKQGSCIDFPFIPERSVKTRIVSRLKPQWVLRRDTMEEITNSLQAIQLVMDTLGIPF